jgi:hypothetical protein
LHSTLKADSATVVGLTSIEDETCRPVKGHSDTCGGVLIELRFAASMNQSLMRLMVHSFVSIMLRRVSFGSSPTRLKEYKGGCLGQGNLRHRRSERAYIGTNVLEVRKRCHVTHTLATDRRNKCYWSRHRC